VLTGRLPVIPCGGRLAPSLVDIQVRQAVSPTAQVQAMLDDPTRARSTYRSSFSSRRR